MLATWGSRREPLATSLALASLLAVLVMPAPAPGARGETLLISRANGPSGVAGNAASNYGRISGDGRFVVFYSNADNLSADDDDAFQNIFVRDAQTGTTTLVSRADGPTGAAANNDSSDPTISADGRFVAFGSGADNLSPDDDDAFNNIFVRDTLTGTTMLVSRMDGPAGGAANGISGSPSISADGRFVAFQSDAYNLSTDDDNTVTDIFVRDLQTGTTTLASRPNAPPGTVGHGVSRSPSISADGRFVAFVSDADDLSADDDNTVTNVFVRDLQTGTTALVSRADGLAGAGANGSSDHPSISADGRFVAFDSTADNLSAEDNDAFTNVFVRDLQAGTTILVSRADGPSGAGGDQDSDTPSISADGRFVAFESNADDLSADDDNAQLNIFVRDTQTGTTTLVSRADGPSGAGGDTGSYTYGFAISANGRFVTFESSATNLTLDDDKTFSDVFRRDVRGGPPHCADVTQAVLRDSATAVALTCADDDGDPMTRSIVSAPSHGSPGPIDQAGGTVTYSPSPGYAGPDAFTFRASDASGDSDVATATLTVAGCAAAATFASIGCRLDELVAARAAGAPNGRLGTKLGRLLTRTQARLAAAEAERSGGRVRAARKTLGKAAKALGAFDHALVTRAARKLDPVTVTSLRAAAAALRRDVLSLRG
jgi:Tol biopolymer transport system component